jgi:hypothetical protein
MTEVHSASYDAPLFLVAPFFTMRTEPRTEPLGE